MNIYIPIEIKVRELEGRNLLAFAAAERGHTVIIGEKKDTIGLAAKGKLPPGIVHMKSITPHDAMMRTLSKLKMHGHSVTVQDEESGLLDESYDTFAKLRFSEESLSLVDGVFGWGEHDTKSLKDMYPKFENIIYPLGSPRVDFWRKDFAKYFRNPPELNGVSDKPYIMIVSNFGTLLNENRFWNVIARLRYAGYFDRKDNREFHEYENAAYQIQLVGEFIKMIRHLANKYPDLNILVRPHPVESIEGWERLIGDSYPNIYVNRDGTISRWIRNSITIIHNGCTSALEAKAAGVNRIAYRPLPHRIEREIPNLASINAMNLIELERFIDEMLHTKDKVLEDKKNNVSDLIIRNRFSNLDGKIAADRIVKQWESIAKSKNFKSSPSRELLGINRDEKIQLNKRIKRKLVQLRNIVITAEQDGKKSNKLLETGHKFPDFKEEEIKTLLINLGDTLSRFEKIKYEPFGEKSFLIYSDYK